MTGPHQLARHQTNGASRRNGQAMPGPRSFGPQPTSSPVPTNTGPPAVALATVPEFMSRLQAMRRSLGLSYVQIGTQAGHGFGKSTAARVLADVDTLITLKHLKLFLKACKVTPADRDRWLRAWDLVNQRATKTTTPARDTTAANGALATSSEDVGDGLGENTEVRPSPPVQAATDSSAERTPVDTEDPAPAPARRPSNRSVVRSVLAISALVAIITGSTVAMWVTGVPTEVITLAYGLVIVCVAAWVAVARMAISAQFEHKNRDRPLSSALSGGDPEELFGSNDLISYSPVIGGQ